MAMNIRIATESDLDKITEIYKECFPNERYHHKWIRACYQSYPKGIYYVIESENTIVGYILWCIKNGFRDAIIAELEQLAVHPSYAGRGYGKSLIKISYEMYKHTISEFGFSVGAVLVTTSEGNHAENLYKSTLGVENSALIKNYGSGNELILYKKF
jgi:ribosomal protein S18 acetylase RimI-like enzyme